MNARWWFLLFVLGVAACAPTATSNTAVPTLTLIPATATLTPTIAPPTSTPGALSAPEDVVPATAPPVTPAASSGAALIQRDPVAAVLVETAQQMIAGELDLPSSRVRLLDVVPVEWTDSTLNCPPSNSTPVPQQTLGYRILLQVGDQTYIMHADFDRVVACAAENEQLPPGFPTPEVTAEITAEATAEPAS